MANEILRELNIDVARENTFQAVLAKQYDKSTRYILATITNLGERINIAPGSTVVINFRRPDNETKGYSGTVESDGRVKVPLPYWALELDGTVITDISIYAPDERLTTLQFVVKVEAATYGGDGVLPDDRKDILLELIGEVQTALTASEKSAEEAAKSEASAKSAAEYLSGAQSREELRIESEKERVAAETTRKTNETARETAETKRNTEYNQLKTELGAAIENINAAAENAAKVQEIYEKMNVTWYVDGQGNLILDDGAAEEV